MEGETGAEHPDVVGGAEVVGTVVVVGSTGGLDVGGVVVVGLVDGGGGGGRQEDRGQSPGHIYRDKQIHTRIM